MTKTKLHGISYSNFGLGMWQLPLAGRTVGRGLLNAASAAAVHANSSTSAYHPGLQCRHTWKNRENAAGKPSPGVKHCHSL